MQLAPPEPSHCPDAMPPPDLPKVSETTKSGRADAPETDGGLEGLECSGFRHSLLPEYLGSTPSAPLPPPPSWPEPVESGAMGQEDQGWSSFHALHAEELQGKLAMLARRMNLEAYPHKQNRFGADFALPPGTHLGMHKNLILAWTRWSVTEFQGALRARARACSLHEEF